MSAVGESFPVHSTANGKAALSLLDNDAIVNLLKQSLIKETSNTITDIKVLVKEIEKVRETKIACDKEEHSEGICALGTAFHDPLGRVFAVSVPVPTVRFIRAKESITEALISFRKNLFKSLNEE